MSKEFSTAEIAAGCPVVLLADELTMQDRINTRIEEMNNSGMGVEGFVGFAEKDGGLQPVVTKGTKLTSRRKLNGHPQADDREVRPVAVGLFKNLGGYEVSLPDFDLEKGRLGAIIKSGVTPQTKKISIPDDLVFQTYPPHAPDQTRGGIFGALRNGTPTPLITTHKGKQYAIEIKGCGHANSGFRPAQDQLFKPIVFGGLPLKDAHGEINNMRRASEAGLTPMLPLAMAKLDFTGAGANELGELGIVIRLTPSTLRLSYSDTPASVTPESSEEAMVIVGKLLDNFLGKFLQEPEAPIFISPASHLENYLVTEGITLTETDFEDFRDFGSSDFPFVHTQTADFIDTRTVLEHYFTNFARVEHFDAQNGHKVVAAMAERKLGNAGIEVDLSGGNSMQEIANNLWYGWLIEREHQARLGSDYMPEQMLRYFGGNDARLIKISDSAEDDQEITPFINFYLAVMAGDLNPEIFGELPEAFMAIGAMYNTTDITNRDRYKTLVHADKYLRTKIWEAGKRSGLDVSEIPKLLTEAVEAAFLQYEYAARICSAVKFFEDWVNSEVNYFAALAVKGVDGLNDILHNLIIMQNRVKEVLDANDPDELNDFYMDELEGYVAITAHNSSKLYRAK